MSGFSHLSGESCRLTATKLSAISGQLSAKEKGTAVLGYGPLRNAFPHIFADS
jgi:hypothetical protein